MGTICIKKNVLRNFFPHHFIPLGAGAAKIEKPGAGAA